ncbi:MAG: carotenoid biosynthesis protein [Spirochaetota bacterium]|nr:carotenoid biosynthesis protein [Spirochaetota bacterium]
MEREKFIQNINPYKFLIIFFCIGALGHAVPQTLPIMLNITPYALLFSGSFVILSLILNKQYKELLYFFVIGVFTFIAECVGVNYGYIFGYYSYGWVLGAKIFGVPIIIAFNWILVIIGSFSFSQLITEKKHKFIILAVIVPVLFDYIMEPAAIKLGYWSWEGGDIPLKNYISWVLISLVSAVFFVIFKLNIKNRLAMFYLVLQLCYFLILRILIVAGII